jgi:hypothetical protein
MILYKVSMIKNKIKLKSKGLLNQLNQLHGHNSFLFTRSNEQIKKCVRSTSFMR